jgi:hypothetical protein
MAIRRRRAIDIAAQSPVAINWDDPLARGLAHAFPLNEAAGYRPLNLAGGPPAAGLTYAGRVFGPRGGSAILVNAAIQRLVTGATNLNFPRGTITWWARPTTSFNDGSIRVVWGQTADSSGNELTVLIYTTNAWYAGWRNPTTDTRVTFPATAINAPANTWSFYAFTWAPTGSAVYMNGGVLLGSNAVAPVVARDSISVRQSGRIRQHSWS